MLGRVTSFPLLPPRGVVIIIIGGFNPSQKGGYAMPYTNQPQMGGYAHFPNQMGHNSQQGMYSYVNNPYPGMPYGGSV